MSDPLLLVCIGGGAVTAAAFAPFMREFQVVVTTTAFGAMTTFVMSCGLLLYRGLGYRLQRVQTEKNNEVHQGHEGPEITNHTN